MKKKELELVCPKDSIKLEKDSMILVEGGASVKVNKKMLSKAYCNQIASKYTKETGLSKSRIAKEIYAHAYLYYAASVGQVLDEIIRVPNPVLETFGSIALQGALSWIKSHANPINIGEDNALRVGVYNILWNM